MQLQTEYQDLSKGVVNFMKLSISEMIRLFETGEMPGTEEVIEPETSLISTIETENAYKKTISSVLEPPKELTEPTMPNLYKNLAKTIEIKGNIDVGYSAESIAKQLKDKLYPSKEVPTPVQSALDAYATFGVALTKIPRSVAASVLQAMQGKEGASVADKDWADRFITDANMDIQKFAKEAYMRYGDKGFAGIKITDLAELPQNVGYSTTSMISGLAVGLPLAVVPMPGFRVAAWGAGTLASGAVAYNATTYQIMQQYLEVKNKESEIYRGVGITREEELRLKEGFNKLAHQYGLWEAVPEALSNLAFGKLLLTPLSKMVGKSIAGQIVGRLAGLYGEEFLTETITQMGQAGVEVKAGLREGKAPDWDSPTDWINAFKEIAPQTFLLTTLMAGAGTTVIGTAKAIKDIKKSLRNEIGTGHVHYEGFLRKLGEAEKPNYGPQYGEKPLPVTDKKTILKTTEDVSNMSRLDKKARACEKYGLDPKDFKYTILPKGEVEVAPTEEDTSKVIKDLQDAGYGKEEEATAEELILKHKKEKGKVHTMTKDEFVKRIRAKAQAKKTIHNEKVNILIRSMEASGKIPSDVNKSIVKDNTLLQRITSGVSTYWAGNRIIENIAGYLDRTRPYGPNWKIFTGDINDAENSKLEGNYNKLEGLQNFLTETFGAKKMTSAITNTRKVGRFILSDSDIMAVYQGSFDPQVVRHLVEGNDITKKDIETCIDIVENNPQMKGVVDWITERYSEDHAPLAKVYKEQTGKDLPKRPFYMHLPVDFKGESFEKDNIAEQMMQRDQIGTHAYVSRGITKARVRSSRPINLGYIENYLKYMSESEHYKAYAQPIKNILSILKDPRYRMSVQRNMNNASLQALDKYVKDVSGTKTGSDLGTMDRVASLLRRHTGIVLIGMNILSGFRQTLSGFNATAEVGPYWMLRGIDKVTRDHQNTEKLIFSKSEQIKHRAGMWERFISEERKAEKVTQVITGKLTPRKAFMAFASWFDRQTVLAAASATYDKVISTGKLMDGTRVANADLERMAVLEMDRVSRKTQPHVGAKDLPGWHRGSTIALMFTLFQNMSNKVVNYVDYDIVGKLKYGTTTPGNAAQKLLFSVILPALLLGMIARGRFPNIKEALLDVARFPLHGMFLVGSMVNTVIDEYGEWTSPVLGGPQAAVEAGAAIKRGDWARAGKFGLETAAYALGVPYNQPYRTYKGLRALMNDETDDWRRLIWSDYALTK